MNVLSPFKISLIFLFCSCCGYFYAGAQINPKIYMKVLDLEKMKSRKLLVELIEPDEKKLEKLEKKKNKDPERYEQYIAKIKDYNQYIQSAIMKYWHLNQDFEFVKTSQIDDILNQSGQKKNKDYALLRLAELSDMDIVFGRKSDIGVMLLNYGRSEQITNKPDYHIYIPNTGIRNNALWTESDIVLAVRMLHNHIEYIASKKKVINFDDFQEISVNDNCVHLNAGILLIDSLLIDAKNVSNIIREIEVDTKLDIQLTDNNSVLKALNENENNTYTLACIPYGIAKPESIIPGFSASILITGKLMIHCKDAQIYNSHEWIKRGIELGFKKVKPGIQKRNIEGILTCNDKIDAKIKQKKK